MSQTKVPGSAREPWATRFQALGGDRGCESALVGVAERPPSAILDMMAAIFDVACGSVAKGETFVRRKRHGICDPSGASGMEE